MKIPNTYAVLSQVPPPVHGSTMMTQILLEHLAQMGLDAVLIDRRFSRDIEAVGKFQIRKLLSAIMLLARAIGCFIRRRPSHLVVFISSSFFAFISDLTVVTIARLLQVKIIHYVHTMGFQKLSERSSLTDFLVSWAFNSAEQIVVLSEVMKSDLPSLKPSVQVRVIPNTNGLEKALLIKPVESDGRFRVLFFSNLIESKGVLDFLEMAERINVEGVEVDYLIAGATVDEHFFERVKAKVASLTGQKSIQILGKIGQAEKSALLARSDLLVFPSYYPLEAQPMVIIEALAFGKPVVGYSVGAVRDMIGDAGLVVEPRNIESLVGAVESVISSSELRHSLSQNAVRQFNSRFSAERFAESWAHIVHGNETKGSSE